MAQKVKTERHFRQCLAANPNVMPELMILGNFVVERHGIQSLCREMGIDTVCSEDGFFPHYQTLHADPGQRVARLQNIAKDSPRATICTNARLGHAYNVRWLVGSGPRGGPQDWVVSPRKCSGGGGMRRFWAAGETTEKLSQVVSNGLASTRSIFRQKADASANPQP